MRINNLKTTLIDKIITHFTRINFTNLNLYIYSFLYIYTTRLSLNARGQKKTLIWLPWKYEYWKSKTWYPLRGHVHIHVATHNVESTLLLLPTHPPQIMSTVAAPYLISMNTSPLLWPLFVLVLIYFRMIKSPCTLTCLIVGGEGGGGGG